MAVPPWVQGTMSNDARNMLESNIEGLFMGGERHEQLFRARGSFRVAGEKEVTFTATGLRINRIGMRNVSEFWGHCWQSAVFPSGKAFGYIAYPPRPDGTTSYNEGYIFDGTKMIPAKVIEAPRLNQVRSSWRRRRPCPGNGRFSGTAEGYDQRFHIHITG
jgi:hypothetical protein